MMIPTKWQRIILLVILIYEGIGGLLGGILLTSAPDGRLMDIPVEIMHGTFADFFIPGLILTGMGILTTGAFFSVLFKFKTDWILAGMAMGGYIIWFTVEILILRELHWLHIMWGVPVLVGGLMVLLMIRAGKEHL